MRSIAFQFVVYSAPLAYFPKRAMYSHKYVSSLTCMRVEYVPGMSWGTFGKQVIQYRRSFLKGNSAVQFLNTITFALHPWVIVAAVVPAIHSN